MLTTGVQLPPEPPRVRIFPHVEGNYATVVYITGQYNCRLLQHTARLKSYTLLAG